MHVYIEENIVYEYEITAAELDGSGLCTFKRKTKILSRFQPDPMPAREFRLYSGASLRDYAAARGMELGSFNPDEEFCIIAKNAASGAKLESSTRMEGKNMDVLVTNVRLDNPLGPGESLEVEMEYGGLGGGLLLASLWQEPHTCRILVKPDTQTRDMEAAIIFPESPPGWFVKSGVGVRPVPGDWASVERRADNGRESVILRAVNLNVGINYRINIEAGGNVKR